jgi:hypothetical protein
MGHCPALQGRYETSRSVPEPPAEYAHLNARRTRLGAAIFPTIFKWSRTHGLRAACVHTQAYCFVNRHACLGRARGSPLSHTGRRRSPPRIHRTPRAVDFGVAQARIRRSKAPSGPSPTACGRLSRASDPVRDPGDALIVGIIGGVD